ncbi:MAG: threonylcarbamoyl-AMP synthase [Candidatus Marinimicrobia bacterium]|nr:threonylcarbamoyl-AMP synthase [Candidatus Neomarinimicrobiota bacterium]
MIVLNLEDAPGSLTKTQELQIRETLIEQGVIVYPTDTLYGLGVDACSDESVENLYRLKQRKNAPVSVLLSSVDQLFEITHGLDQSGRHLIHTFLPGALTVICNSKYPFAKRLFSDTGTIGFRVSADPVSVQIPKILGNPITTTSVNPGGAAPARSRAEVFAYYLDQVQLMLDVGSMVSSKGSTVIDLTTRPFKILREGEIPREMLAKYLN